MRVSRRSGWQASKNSKTARYAFGRGLKFTDGERLSALLRALQLLRFLGRFFRRLLLGEFSAGLLLGLRLLRFLCFFRRLLLAQRLLGPLGLLWRGLGR